MSDNTQIPRLQWFVFILVTFWLVAAMVLTVVTFCLTRNPLSLSLFATLMPPSYLIYHMVKCIFPKRDKDYELIEAQMKYKAEIAKAKYAAHHPSRARETHTS